YLLVHYVKSSLSKCLDHFQHLTGHLAAVEHDDNTTSVFFDCNNGRALFVHAVVDEVSSRDIIKPVYVPSFVDSIFPLRGVKNCQGTIEPLVAVQVTKLVDGDFISISINHSIMDGASFFHAFSSCLEIVNGSSSLSKPLIFQRCFLNNNTIDNFHTIRIPNSYINQADDAPSDVKVKVFHFTKEVIAKLKEKSNVDVGINDEISSLQALLCHLWRSIVFNKKIDPDQETSYCLLIDARKQIRGLSEAYFGNALQIETVTMKVKELLMSRDNGLGNAAWQMNKLVASCHEEKLRNFFECWKRCPKLTRLSNLVPNIAVVTSGSPRFDIYGGNTELGRPVAIRSGPGNKFDGRATVQSGKEDGSIDIEVCLPVETFEAMEKDKEFMDTVSIKS
ncbi:uncharacterized acetyltransferase At3g50280, partial [Gossypium raimondii]|uniref:uncharacterized acetyltransferase At3g50280 n=1 Tax=Gossypium raimondii TaxID=29730 RepID=UPI00227B8177